VGEPFQPGGRAPAPPPLDLVQDFVNTEIPDWARDDIATPELLAGWLRERRLLEPGAPADAEGFVAARELRSSLRRLALLNTLRESPEPELVAAVSEALAPVVLRVVPDGTGRLVAVPAGAGVERALGAIVAVVLEAQVSGSWSRVKACRQETCGWVFYDGSRNLSSSWCSMSICGNRTKSAAYRRRRKASS
jgi:predicted RNA-binding Zn ribbon-like protein